MGRRPGNPQDQAALGYPGKRKTKTEKAILEAERLAGLLVAARSDTPSDSMPAYLRDPRLKAASAVWADYAPRLDKLHLLSHLDLHLFAVFCIYAAEFVMANEEILAKGYSVMVKTVSGDRMPRENPAVARRDFAAKLMIEQSSKFGLTPHDRNRLLRDSAMRDDHETLFGRVLQQPAAAADDQVDDQVAAELPAPATLPSTPEGSAIGTLGALDSLPPGAKPN